MSTCRASVTFAPNSTVNFMGMGWAVRDEQAYK